MSFRQQERKAMERSMSIDLALQEDFKKSQRIVHVLAFDDQLSALLALESKLIFPSQSQCTSLSSDSEDQVRYSELLDTMLSESAVSSTTDSTSSALVKGVVEVPISYKNLDIVLLDVRGIVPKLKKFLHFFDNVTSLLFSIDISSFDAMGTEGFNKKLDHIESIRRESLFEHTSVIIFLKGVRDLERKLATSTSAFNSSFPEYQGSNDLPEVVAFLRRMVESRLNSPQRNYYDWLHVSVISSHYGMNIQQFFDAITDGIIANNLRGCDLDGPEHCKRSSHIGIFRR